MHASGGAEESNSSIRPSARTGSAPFAFPRRPEELEVNGGVHCTIPKTRKNYSVANQRNPERLRRIVIVDDEAAFAAYLTILVRGLGYDVMVSLDPRSSRTYELRDSDIIFLDILMPHVSGLQVLEQLARQNVKSAIVLMSGHGELLDKAEKLASTLELQVIGALEKPFRLVDIKLVLEGT